VYTRRVSLDRRMHGAVYGVVLLMPFSVLYPLSEPLGPGEVALYVRAGLELADIPAGILLLLAAFDRWSMWQDGVSSQRTPVFAVLVLSVALFGVASIVAADAPHLAAFMAMRWLLAAGVLWAIIQVRVCPQRLAGVLAFTACLHCVVAVLQVWRGEPLGLPGELALPPDRMSASVVHLGERVWLRGYGLTFHPNVLGGYAAVALTLLIPLLSSRLVQLAACILVVGLAATLSRSAGLGLVVVVPLLIGWLWRVDTAARPALRRAAVILASITLVSGVVFWKPITVRLAPVLEFGPSAGDRDAAEQLSLVGRGRLSAIAVEIMLRHPLLGVGAGNFPVALEAARSRMLPEYVHSVPLLLGAEVGVGGLIVWLAIAVWTGFVLVRKSPSKWTVVAAAAWSVLFIVSLFDCYPWSLNAGRLLTVTVLALLECSRSDPARLGPGA